MREFLFSSEQLTVDNLSQAMLDKHWFVDEAGSTVGASNQFLFSVTLQMTLELKNISKDSLTSIPTTIHFDISQYFSTISICRDSSIKIKNQVMIDMIDELGKLRVRGGAAFPIAEVIVGDRWYDISASRISVTVWN